MPAIAMTSPDDKQTAAKQDPPEDQPDKQLWRDLVAFWFLGLCNNFGYVVMLSAAHDIIARFNSNEETPVHLESFVTRTQRQCNVISTGAILLADVLPAFIVKVFMPFIPLWVNIRMVVLTLFGVSGFLLVAFAEAEKVAILGVICTSAACGIGESTFLAYSSKFNRNVVSTWSSGTGGAGVIGALSYAGLISLGVSPKNTMLIMLAFPCIQCIAFWIVLRHPQDTNDSDKSNTAVMEDEKPLQGYKEKMLFITTLCKYIMPLIAVYLFEYFINQGLFELVHFENTFLSKEAQYRWLCVDYQIGVFISRSSVNLIHFRQVWILSALQLVNLVYFLTEVIYYYTPNIWIAFAVVLWEGLLGGGAYVNTFYRMATDVAKPHQEFAIGVAAQADAIGIMLAGFLAIPAHNAICKLPAPDRATT